MSRRARRKAVQFRDPATFCEAKCCDPPLAGEASYLLCKHDNRRFAKQNVVGIVYKLFIFC